MKRTSSTSSDRTRTLPRIALTSGEPAGVGPELCLAVAARPFAAELVCLADRGLLEARARLVRSDVALHDYDPAQPLAHSPGHLRVLHLPCEVPSIPGQLDVRNAAYVVRLLERAADGCLSGEFAALATAPVQKSVLNDAGVAFTGHTEFLAQRTGAALPVMLLATGTLRVALVTTHLPLKDVSAALTFDRIVETLRVVDREMKRFWRIARPRIAACGLNPHAGEGGHLGDEELRVIAPAIAQCRGEGIEVEGPLPADTAFVPRTLERYDVVLAMYHDQGLPVLKHAGFGSAVNVTLGLPIVRTSVDHGTALDLAGTGRADAGSLAAAVALAGELAHG